VVEPAPALDRPDRASVTAWVLAGGEGRRMGGIDKGLQPWGGQPLAQWVMSALRHQVAGMGLSANRNLSHYEQLLGDTCSPPAPGSTGVHGNGSGIRNLGTHPDDPDLPERSGPLAGILTGLRHSPTDWLQLASCDTPRLPGDLVHRLLLAACTAHADIAVPCTEEASPDGPPQVRPHWTCALVHKRTTPELAAAFVKGDRKVGQWIRSLHWVAVSFAPASDFENMNTLETLDGRD
jgi:molybdopterin-guanine dinucleotide biosynthesis protein A